MINDIDPRESSTCLRRLELLVDGHGRGRPVWPPLYRPRRRLAALQGPAARVIIVVTVVVVVCLGHVEGLVAVVQG